MTRVLVYVCFNLVQAASDVPMRFCIRVSTNAEFYCAWTMAGNAQGWDDHGRKLCIDDR